MTDASNGKDPNENKGTVILAPMWSLTILALILVVARIFIRTKVVKSMGLDDWLIMVAMVLSLVYVGITTANVCVGYGRHAFTLSVESLNKAILLNTIGFLFGILSFTVPKMAVAAMLIRIMNPSRWHRIWVWFLVSFAAAVSIVCILLLFTSCDPPQAMWNVTMVNATCRNPWILIDYAIFTGGLSAFVDCYLAIYPATVLWKLQLSTRKKVALTAALGLGAIAAAMAIVKCTQLNGLADTSDYTFGTYQLVIWTAIESNVVIMASCIPTLQPLLEFLTGKRKMGSSYNSNSNKRYFDRLEKGSKPYNSESIEMHSKRSQPKHHSISITNIEGGQESQESILPSETPPHHDPLGHIRRTDDVSVQYESRSVNHTGSRTRAW